MSFTATILSSPLSNTLESDSTLRTRSEEHTSELQSRLHLVCRLLLEKKKKTTIDSELWNINPLAFADRQPGLQQSITMQLDTITLFIIEDIHYVIITNLQPLS